MHSKFYALSTGGTLERFQINFRGFRGLLFTLSAEKFSEISSENDHISFDHISSHTWPSCKLENASCFALKADSP